MYDKNEMQEPEHDHSNGAIGFLKQMLEKSKGNISVILVNEGGPVIIATDELPALPEQITGRLHDTGYEVVNIHMADNVEAAISMLEIKRPGFEALMNKCAEQVFKTGMPASTLLPSGPNLRHIFNVPDAAELLRPKYISPQTIEIMPTNKITTGGRPTGNFSRNSSGRGYVPKQGQPGKLNAKHNKNRRR